MTRTVDTLTDDEVAAYIETRRHKPRAATARDIHSQRMKWTVEEIRAEEREWCAKIADGWCRCSEPYPSMGLIDPGCDAHHIAGDIREQEADNDV